MHIFIFELFEIGRTFFHEYYCVDRTDVLITLAGLYDEAGDYEKELRALKRYGQLERLRDYYNGN